MDVEFVFSKASQNTLFSDSTSCPDHAAERKSFTPIKSFYYIGEIAGNSSAMFNLCEMASSFDTLENARSALTRGQKKMEQPLFPEVICCAPGFPVKSLKIFRSFLDSDPALSQIPFVLDGSGLSNKELDDHRKNKCVDEIIFPADDNKRKLIAKLRFIQKVKSRSGRMDKSSKPINTS
ncbi:MAG TPA: hypothetical protein VKR32_17290, partial [Puia sp.]|nr:hypothetical protein [Puia sp.]